MGSDTIQRPKTETGRARPRVAFTEIEPHTHAALKRQAELEARSISHIVRRSIVRELERVQNDPSFSAGGA